MVIDQHNLNYEELWGFHDVDAVLACSAFSAEHYRSRIGLASTVLPVPLAGAFGKEVWTLLAFGGEWRWLTEREDTPWYPGMLLFRQRRPGDWAKVVGRVREAWQARLAAATE